MKISIIVPCYNEISTIDKIIDKINKIDLEKEIIIIDIYICTSNNEASPLSVWEAMSMEKAIISTDVGDVGKFIDDGLEFHGTLYYANGDVFVGCSKIVSSLTMKIVVLETTCIYIAIRKTIRTIIFTITTDTFICKY